MPALLPTAFFALCVALGPQDPNEASQAAPLSSADLQSFPEEPPSIDARLAELVRQARDEAANQRALAERIAALGQDATPALLDAYVFGRIAPDALHPEQDVELSAAERAALVAVLARMDSATLRDLAQSALVTPSASVRTRALAAFELAARGEDLERALAVAATADAEGEAATQQELERAIAAIALRDKRTALRLGELLPNAADWIALALVRGLASAGSAEAVLALAEELDRSVRHELLLLGELARAARTAPQPCDARASSEVVDRLRSADPSIARAAALAAGALEESEAVPGLIALLDAPNAGVRESAHAALREISRCTYGPSSGAWTAWLERERAWIEKRAADLERQVASPDAGKALAALREISAHKFRRHELAALAGRALEHPSPEVRRAACAALAELGSRASAPRLTERLSDEDAQVARAAREGLARVGGPDAAPAPR